MNSTAGMGWSEQRNYYSLILFFFYLTYISRFRCVEVVEKFLSIDLDDTELDPDSYLKDEVLPTLEKVLW